jgi:hypothetical protein
MMRLYKYLPIVWVLLLVFFAACSDDGIPMPKRASGLESDCIKRSLGPNVAGLNIEFVYAVALPPELGKLVGAKVEASVAGAEGTYLEHRSFYTDGSGSDIPVVVANPCVTSGTGSEVTFTADTCAASLRYYYRIPQEAKGQNVEFTFSAKAGNGQEVSCKMGPYGIARMDMALDIVTTDGENCFLSIADMTAYGATEAASRADRIDLVYLYRDIPNVTFAHAFVAPASDPEFRPDVMLPPGVGNNTPIRKVYGLRDRHLARLQYGVYVDDPDFADLDFGGMPNYAVNVKNEGGLWVETQDGKYRAYVFINTVNPGSTDPGIPSKSAKISIKRYTMK